MRFMPRYYAIRPRDHEAFERLRPFVREVRVTMCNKFNVFRIVGMENPDEISLP